MRAVRFDAYGSLDVLQVAEVEDPRPDPGEVLIRVRAAGLNPGEVAIRSGAMASMSPAHFPEGQGTDLAGTVAGVGDGVPAVQVGDEVLGWSDRRGAQAELAVLPAENLIPKPHGMSPDQAAVLPVVCATAVSSLWAVQPHSGETLVVAGAAGGVGHVLVQLARRAGVRVIGTASDHHHDALRVLGVEPVAYGDGLLERLRDMAPNGIDAFADCHGDGNVDMALELGVPAERINTIIDFAAAKSAGARTSGMYQLTDIRAALVPVIDAVAAGEVTVPIRASFALDEVRDAYRLLEKAGGGKIVLLSSSTGGNDG